MELPQSESTLVMVTNDGMGNADRELRQKLIQTYLSLLNGSNVIPWAICFYTDGVKLVTEGSPVLPVLQLLEK